MPDQRAALAKHAAGRFQIVGEYVDDGISGDATDDRHAFQRMIADAPRAEWTVILCWDQERFGRFDSVEAGHYVYLLRKSGVSLETIAHGPVDWNDFTGRLMYSIQQEAKHSFLRDLSRNVARGMSSAVALGRWPGGRAPFGYSLKDGKLFPNDDADTVRVLYRQYLDGESTARLARWLDAQGVPTARGRPWTNQAVRQILVSEVYTGAIVWNRRTVSKYQPIAGGEPMRFEAAHDALIDRETFDKVAAELPARRSRTTTRKARGVYAFSGLLFCGACGHAMHGRPAWNGKPCYVCGAAAMHGRCRLNWTFQDDLIAKLASMLKSLVTPAALAAMREEMQAEIAPAPKLPANRARTIEAKLKRAKARLIEVDRDMLAVVQEQIRELQAQLKTLRSERTEAMPADAADKLTARLKDVSAIVTNADPESLRKELGTLFSRIVVHVSSRLSGKKRFYTLSHADAVLLSGTTIRLS